MHASINSGAEACTAFEQKAWRIGCDVILQPALHSHFTQSPISLASSAVAAKPERLPAWERTFKCDTADFDVTPERWCRRSL
ncbi:hypothetical protein BST61_g3020 [Cercospora zeina]